MKKELLVKETYKKTEELWNKITPKFLFIFQKFV